jgi:hypothetical protein
MHNRVRYRQSSVDCLCLCYTFEAAAAVAKRSILSILFGVRGATCNNFCCCGKLVLKGPNSIHYRISGPRNATTSSSSPAAIYRNSILDCCAYTNGRYMAAIFLAGVEFCKVSIVLFIYSGKQLAFCSKARCHRLSKTERHSLSRICFEMARQATQTRSRQAVFLGRGTTH